MSFSGFDFWFEALFHSLESGNEFQLKLCVLLFFVANMHGQTTMTISLVH